MVGRRSISFVFSSIKDTVVNTDNAKKTSDNMLESTIRGVNAIKDTAKNVIEVSEYTCEQTADYC